MSAFIVSKIFSLYLMATLINRPAARPNDGEAQFLFRDKRDVQVCYTEECIKLDEMLVATMERKIDPCENFYEYVCKYHNVSKTTAGESFENIAAKVAGIIQKPIGVKDSSALVMAKEMYQTCVNHTPEMGELKKLVYSFGGWDYSEEPGEEFSLEKFYTKAAAQGYVPRSLFTVDMYTDSSLDSYMTVILIREADMRLKMMETVEWTFSSNGVNHSQTFFPMLLEKLQIYPIEGEKAIKEYEAVRDVVLKINQLPTIGRRSNVSQLNLDYPNIPWNAILSAIFQPLVIKDDEKVIISCPECLSQLNDFIGNTSKRSLSTYLLWSMVTAVAYTLDNELLDNYLEFTKGGKREDYCVDKTTEYELIAHPTGVVEVLVEEYLDNKAISDLPLPKQFRRVIDYEYVRRYFDNCSICEATTYVQWLKNSLGILINDDKTLDNDTKKDFYEKTDKMRFKMAFDEAIKTDLLVEEYYSGLELDPKKSYFRALLALSKFFNKKNVRALRQPLIEPYLKATGYEIAYKSAFNAIYLSTFIVEDLRVSENRPQYDNFGHFGYIIAHEMNHAFDPQHVFENATGVFNNKTSWSQSTIDERFKKFECIRKQYSEYTDVEIGVKVDISNQIDIKGTLNENVALNGGIQLAYHAYDLWLRSNEEQDRALRHFKQFTPRQMFWMSFARGMCYTPSKWLSAQRRIRVIRALRNSEAFAKDWNCESGSLMNPAQKCHIWGA